MPSLHLPAVENASLHAELTPESCARIVASHGSLVRAACRRILRDESLAEDAAQETFVLLVRKARTLPPRTPLAGWLYHAACRTARNHLRTVMRRKTRESSPEARENLAPETTDPLWRELEPHLDEAMHTLPARQRDLVVQCYFQNQSQRDAARTLGFSESVASRELHEAIEALRRFFARRGWSIGSGALVAAISANAARGAGLAGSSQIVGAMLAAKQIATGVSLAVLMKSGTAKIAAAVLLAAGIVSYEIASTNSRPASAFQKTEDAPLAAPIAASSNAPTPSATRESAEREAAALLAAVPRFENARALEAAMLEAILCRDVDEQLALLQRMGVTISRSALEAEVHGIRWWTNVVNGASRARFSVGDVSRTKALFFGHLLEVWARESPQAALVWMTPQSQQALFSMWSNESLLLPILCAAVQSERIAPAMWDALLAGAVSGSAGDYVAAYRKMKDAPAEFLKSATQKFELHDPRYRLRAIALEEAMKSDPAATLTAVQGSDDAKFREWAILWATIIVTKPADLRALAEKVFADRPMEGNFLRAVGGDPTASFAEAVEHFADSRLSVYRTWRDIDADAAVAHVFRRGDDDLLEEIVPNGLGNIPEDRFAAWIAGIGAEREAVAWASYYRWRGVSDPVKAIDAIRHSPHVVDAMRSVKSVIEWWTDRQPAEAAKWVRENLPADETRNELLTAVAEHWAAREGVAGLALAAEEGISVTPHLAGQAAGNYAIDHSLAETTAFIRQFQNEDQYQSALSAAAAHAFRGRLDEARDFVRQNQRGNWQVPMVKMLAVWEIDSKATAQSAAQEFMRLNIAQLPADSVSAAANHLAQRIASYDRLPAAFDWTLHLPASVAPVTRQKLVTHFKSTEERAQIGTWLQTAAVAATERAQLSEIVRPSQADVD